MKHGSAICLLALVLTGSSGRPAARAEVNLQEVRQAAVDANSLFLNETGRVSAIETFLKLVSIKGPSGQEQAVGEVVQRFLTEAGAVRIIPQTGVEKAPYNLVLEIPASSARSEEPGLLLNAHLDTIERCTPELLAFDARTRDFYHRNEADPNKVSSFGGDDRSAVAVIGEAVRVLKVRYWDHGITHRRIVLLFTAEEERGSVGAKYLSEHEPQLFKRLELSLTMDGPLDLKSRYPLDSFVAVARESDRTVQPYEHVLQLMRDFCRRTGTSFGQTEIGLGMGDFACFPPSARAGLHLRSPVRGWHNKERVNVQDLIGHVDLLCYILLGLDQKLPADISRDNKSAAPALPGDRR